MVLLRVPRKDGTFFSSFLLLSATVGGIIVLFWATTQLLADLDSSLWTILHLKPDAIDSAGFANASSFPNGITHSAARGEIVSRLPSAPRRRLGGGDSTTTTSDPGDISTAPTFRLALLRPFAPHDATDLVESFIEWNQFIPCDTDDWFGSGSAGGNLRYDADLIFSISQTFSSFLSVKEMIDSLVDNARGQSLLNDNSWGNCFDSVHVIEANITPDVDRYGVSSSDQTDPLWVSGPNEHFIRSIRQMQSMETHYDAVFLMEADARPWKGLWLDRIVAEVVGKIPFSILGSENHGMVWKQNSETMPIALQHHLTGNSVFNLTDPFFNRFVEELEAERETFYHAIPYDYRLSQMFYEASRGVKPDFPFRQMKDVEGKSVILPDKAATFHELWLDIIHAGRDYSIIKESASIENFGATNYLPEQVSPSASIVHGKLLRDKWDKFNRPISLFLLESSPAMSTSQQFLRDLNSVGHPFTEVVALIRSQSSARDRYSTRKSISIPMTMRYFTDESIEEILCNAPISNDWFVIVSSSDHIVSHELLFPVSWRGRNDAVPVPVVPYITLGNGNTGDRKLILDNELVFHRDLYESFCERRDVNFDLDGEPGQSLATRFIAYLDSILVAGTVYDFSDKVLHGYFQNFVAIDESRHPGHGGDYNGSDDGEGFDDQLAIQRALQVLAMDKSKSQTSQYPTTKVTKETTQKSTKSAKGTRRGRRAQQNMNQRNLMLGLQMEAIQFKSERLEGSTTPTGVSPTPANRGIVDAASLRYPDVARFHIYQIAKRGGEEYSLLLTCILQGLLEPDELHAFIPDEEMLADTASFGPRPEDIQDVSYPLLYYNGELMDSREHVGNTLVTQTYESNADVLTQAFGDLFQRNIFVAVHSSEIEDLAIEERFCVRTNVICIDHDDFTYSNDDELIEGVEEVASILRSQVPLFARLDLDIDAAARRVKLMEDAAITMEGQSRSVLDPVFGLMGRQPSPDAETEDDTWIDVDAEPFHIFQVAKPHTGSTLLNAILQGLFDEEDASYSFLPKRPPGLDDLRFGPYPLGVEEADIADVSLPFIVHEGKLKLSRDHLSDTIVTKTHVVDIDLIEETFGRHFEQIYYVVANRAEKDIFIDEKYCSYPNVLCVDYDDFAYSPDSSSPDEIMEKIEQIKKNLHNKFALEHDLDDERTLNRVKKMEEATEMMASKTFDEVENTFGIHGGHRNRDDKPTRANVGGGVTADEGALDIVPPNLVHLFSPYRIQHCDERYCPYDQAQTVAIASMQRAASQATRASVTLSATAFADEANVTPDDFLRLDPLLRSTRSEFPDFVSDKRLPFIADIFEVLESHRDFAAFDYVIYTNSDIIVHERFYDIVALAIDHGHDAFTINRQTVSAIGEDGALFSASDLDTIFSLEGEEHPGSDCFVIRREIFEQIKLGDLYLGFPPFANFILFQIEALAENYRVFESNELKATYHLGDDQSWREDDEGSLELYRHQYRYAIEDLLPLWSSFCLFDWRSESGNSAACTQVIKKFRKFAKTNIDGGIEAIEKMYNERSISTADKNDQNSATSTNYMYESSEKTAPPKSRSSSNKKVTFQFLLGVEGTGHHLHRTMYLSSPVGEWLTSKGVDEDIVNLSLALWDRSDPSAGIWSAPCSNADKGDGEWWKAEEGVPEGDVLFSSLVDGLRTVEKRVEGLLESDPSSFSFSHSEQPLVVAINGGVAGNAKGARRVSPYMSYPMLGGPCRALQFPNLHILYQACDVAGVQCQHSVVVRDPYRVLRSTSMNRHFASRHVQLTTLASMQHVILSQMMAYPDRLVACWEADTETPTQLGELFGWTDPNVFEDAYNEMFIVPSPITENDRKEITKDDHLKVYMGGMVASNNRIKELCLKQLEVNQYAKASAAE